MKPSTAILLTAGCLCASAIANAAQFEFDVLFVDGSLAGQQYTGIVETTAGPGLKTPGNGGVLDFSIDVAGGSYNALTSPFYPDLPTAIISDEGNLVGLSYAGLSTDFDASFAFTFDESDPLAMLAVWTPLTADHPFGTEISAGFITAVRPIASVPDMGSGSLLLGIGALGLMVTLRRRN